MRLSRVVGADRVPEPEPVLSPAHKELLGTIEGLIREAAKAPGSAGVVQVFAGLLPSMKRDVARIPEPTLRRVCKQFAERLENIAGDETGMAPVVLELPTGGDNEHRTDPDPDAHPSDADASEPVGSIG